MPVPLTHALPGSAADERTAVTYVDGDFEAVIEAVHRGDLKADGMITKIIRPDEVAEEGFKALVEDKENQVKILVDMSKAKEVSTTK